MTEIEVNNPERLVELTEIARNIGDNDEVVPILFDALEAHIDDVTEQNSRAAEAQQRTRERLGLTDNAQLSGKGNEHTRRTDDDSTDAVESKQAELQERILGE